MENNQNNQNNEYNSDTQNGYGSYNQNYQYNPYNNINPYGRRQTNPLSVASMILGILATVCCCLGYAGAFFGVVAIVLAVLSSKKAGNFDAMAIAGLILGIFGLVISVFMIVSIYLIPEDVFNEYFDQYYEQFEGAGSF